MCWIALVEVHQFAIEVSYVFLFCDVFVQLAVAVVCQGFGSLLLPVVWGGQLWHATILVRLMHGRGGVLIHSGRAWWLFWKELSSDNI